MTEYDVNDVTIIRATEMVVAMIKEEIYVA